MRTNDEVIELIKEILQQKEISMSELARRVGMAKSAISRYLNKTREFPLNRAEEFAKALGISTEVIFPKFSHKKTGSSQSIGRSPFVFLLN